MAGRPAPLEGSLLARKGDAVPVIPDDSPLMESLEGATSDVVPLHRVETPEPARPAIAPAVVHAAPVSPYRRAAIILVALLVLFLIAVALAARGNRTGAERAPAPAATSGPVSTPAPAVVRAGPSDVSVPDPVPAATPGEPAAPEMSSDGAHPGFVAAPTTAGPEKVELKKPETVTPVLAPTETTKLYVVQFASVRDEERAFQEAARLQKRLGGVLGDRKIVVVGTEVKGRHQYRLRAGAFDSLRAAISVCRDVARLKIECLPIRR